MDIKTANEIIALFEGRKKTMLDDEWWWSDAEQMDLFVWKDHELQYHSDYGWLMPVWVKYRNLKFENDSDSESHWNGREWTAKGICFERIEVAATRLAEAIQFLAWHPNINLPKEYWPSITK